MYTVDSVNVYMEKGENQINDRSIVNKANLTVGTS